ncbi:leucine-rich repeat domain-containing protein, partial [Ruminococcus champanellensis]|uniref:leucine-rich repeat domain-containing protein n=1 Tax=Ruminococcus champanellensis TaxID=1161942 RepID=UPI003AB60E76
MKRIGWIVGLAAGMAAAVCMGAACGAETDDSGRYTYEIQDGKASILHYSWNEVDTVLTIPDTLGGAPVTELVAGAFAECYAESVTLPAGVTYIGDNCFRDCGYLTEAILPKGLETIASSAFEDCVLLKQVEIPDTVTEIETAAFSGTPWLEDRSQ